MSLFAMSRMVLEVLFTKMPARLLFLTHVGKRFLVGVAFKNFAKLDNSTPPHENDDNSGWYFLGNS